MHVKFISWCGILNIPGQYSPLILPCLAGCVAALRALALLVGFPGPFEDYREAFSEVLLVNFQV